MKMRETAVLSVLLAIVLLGIGVWIVRSRPTQADIQAAVRALPSLPSEAVNEQAFEQLNARQVHGELPVVPLPPDPPRGDPFS